MKREADYILICAAASIAAMAGAMVHGFQELLPVAAIFGYTALIYALFIMPTTWGGDDDD